MNNLFYQPIYKSRTSMYFAFNCKVITKRKL